MPPKSDPVQRYQKLLRIIADPQAAPGERQNAYSSLEKLYQANPDMGRPSHDEPTDNPAQEESDELADLVGDLVGRFASQIVQKIRKRQ